MVFWLAMIVCWLFNTSSLDIRFSFVFLMIVKLRSYGGQFHNAVAFWSAVTCHRFRPSRPVGARLATGRQQPERRQVGALQKRLPQDCADLIAWCAIVAPIGNQGLIL